MPSVHLIGIGGSGMSGLAGLFRTAGWQVSGCDRAAVHPPASDTLARVGVRPSLGYSPDHLQPPPDLVVVGNIVRESNAEDREARVRGIPRMHMAQALRSHFIADRTSVVVAGTHGKTTSASMLAYLLNAGGFDPGFFVGGVIRGLGSSFHVGGGQFFVVEGDEYDCAWFDKGPKFLHYRPRYLLITNVEFDHADIFGGIDDVEHAFSRLIAGMPSDGVMVYCAESPTLARLARECPCPAVPYAISNAAAPSWRAADLRFDDGVTRFALWCGEEWVGDFSTGLAGRHNVLNATGVVALCHAMGLPGGEAARHLPGFQGAARRMQVLAEGHAVVVDDFAHHPTEVAATLSAARQRWPGRRMWAVFEPKTQTSRRRVFQRELAEALGLADDVVVVKPHDLEGIPVAEQLDVDGLINTVIAQGSRARSAQTHGDAVSVILKELGDGPVVIVLMSAGSFGDAGCGLVDDLARRGLSVPSPSPCNE